MNLQATALHVPQIPWDYPAPLRRSLAVPVLSLDQWSGGQPLEELTVYPGGVAMSLRDARARGIDLTGVAITGGLGATIPRSQIWGAALTTAGATLLKMSPTSGPAAPFVAAAAGVLMLGGQIVQMFKGCGATCIEATRIANDASDFLNQ